MHEAVTTSQTATKSFFPPTSEDLLSPINLTNRTKSANSLGWSHTHEVTDDQEELATENWHLSPTKPIHRAPSAGLPKFPMNSRTTPSDNSSNMGASRWRLNRTGQLIDSEAASSEWDLADEIVKLKIGGVGGDAGDDVHGPIRTPPQNKMAAAAVVQLNEASPLETSSDTSIDSSEHPSEHQITVAHSRGSSTDTTVSSSHESVLSSASHTLRAPSHSPLKIGTGETKERPHSFSGGLSAADLRRLQQAGEGPGSGNPSGDHQQWSSTQYRDTIGPNDKQFPQDQPTYPSLAHQSHPRPLPLPQQPYDYNQGVSSNSGSVVPHSDDLQVDYHIQQRNFNPLSQGHGGSAIGPASTPFVAGRPHNVLDASYRPPARGFPPPALPLSPTGLGYPGGHHTSHLSLGNTQQLYDMMLPPPHESHHPAVARVQQQHNVFRAGHQHSASDPSAIRDAATLALLNNNMQAFGPPGPGMFPPAMSLYANQFYAGQEAYPRADVATAQAMAARLQSQYTGPYGVVPGQGMGMEVGMGGPGIAAGPASPTGNGPSANNRKLGLYKTELCRSWEEKGTCRYGAKCQFAHGEDELRKVSRHPKYKTEICRTFWVSGSCPYGKRCCFIHTELPPSGAPPGAEGAPPPPQVHGRDRSMSTNSDPNDASISLLARISAKRSQDISGTNNTNASTPVDMTPPSNGFQFSSRPPTGSLRVDTSTLDNAAAKQNKSAYPSFAGNGLLLPAPEQPSAKSPAPVTAGPDLGRHNSSRVEIVGYNQQRVSKPTSTNPNVRHSFNGTDVSLNFSTSPSISGPSPSFAVSAADGNPGVGSTPRANGHSRSGSAGNWGTFTRSSHLAAPSPYPHSSSPGGEVKPNSPWSTSELAVGSSRLNEKAWV